MTQELCAIQKPCVAPVAVASTPTYRYGARARPKNPLISLSQLPTEPSSAPVRVECFLYLKRPSLGKITTPQHSLPPRISMSRYAELLAQKALLDQQIANAKKAESEQALPTVLQLVQEFGFTAQQVFPWKPQPKKVAAKYRDPDTGATWSGRGKPPQWIAGKDRTPFVIGYAD